MDSRAANAVALALAGTLREPAWRERVFSAVHEEGRSLDEPGALEPLARDLGLDVDALIGGIQEESVIASRLGRWAAKRRRAEIA